VLKGLSPIKENEELNAHLLKEVGDPMDIVGVYEGNSIQHH
jgi:hypothetical protein